MLAAHRLATALAAADRDAILPHRSLGLDRQVRHRGEVHPLFDQRAAASGADRLRHWHRDRRLAQLPGTWGGTEVEAPLARLAPRPFGVGHTSVFAERRRLPLAAPRKLL